MKLISFLRPDGAASYGQLIETRVHEASAAFRGQHPDLRAMLTAGAAMQSEDAFALEEVRLLSPLPNPDKIICIGLNYTSHILETGREKPSHPSIFTRYPSSIVGHGADLIRPKASTWFDFEGELAVIIGKAGRDIPAEAAWDHIAGYSCLNDGSIRDFQRHTTQFWSGKNFVASGAMGPWIVTADEVGDVTTKSLETRLNGQVMQSAPISDLAFSIPDLIAYLSVVTELLPGDVIATGTPGGVGLFREPKLFMKAGDVIEVEISGIGRLENQVRDQG